MGLLRFLDFQSANRPTNYGWFHLLFVVLVIAITTLLIIFFRNSDDKVFKRIALIGWIIMVVFEIYKQIVFSCEVTDSGVVWHYNWGSFPFQLCSTPLYTLPFIAFMKDDKWRDAFVSYTSTFAMFGGLVVFLYPNDVFNTDTAGVWVQTMVHHGLQIILGIFFAVHQRKKLGFGYLIKAIPVFAVCLIIACVMNEIGGDALSMFYVSRFVPNHLPILSAVYSSVPWIVFILSYLIGFCICAGLVLYAIVGCIKLANYIKEKRKKNA